MKYNKTDIKNNDLKFGFNKEKDILPIFNTFFNCNAVIASDKYAIFDFHDEEKKIYGELKSRRVRKDKYPTIMIGYNKVKEGLKKIEDGHDVFFLWCFTNRLCYYKLTKDFNKDWVIFNETARTDRGRDEKSDIAYIPIKVLKNIMVLKKT